MKRFAFFLLLAALGVSLWFNWRSRESSSAGKIPGSPENPASMLPVGSGEIDFSGTGFADDSWKLDPAAPADKIPQEVPKPGSAEAPPDLTPPSQPSDWNLDGKLQLAPGKSPEGG